MDDAYVRRGQTAAKHFILRRYLQSLTFKLLHGGFGALSYVDGFSGPWESQMSDHSDTSFMIALRVLKDAQQRVNDATDRRSEVRCFFAEAKPASHSQLREAVMQHHDPARKFFVETHCGQFEDAIDPIMRLVGDSFALTFIDPTGWTGYEFPKIGRLLKHPKGEVLVNYMQSFIDRFTNWDDPKNAETFDGILGPRWQSRLDKTRPRSDAALALFTEQFRAAGSFRYVVSTPIENDEGQVSFRIAYGTRSDRGLETYREAEYDALRNQDQRKTEARRTKEAADGFIDMFADAEDILPIERTVSEACVTAREILLDAVRQSGPRLFGDLWPAMLSGATIRKTNAKDICVRLAAEGVIRATWRDRGPRVRKPDDTDVIALIL